MRVLNEDRKYPRVRPSANEKYQLEKAGFQWTLSSFISAIGTEGNNLLIRFKNSTVYSYPNKATLFDKMLKAPSKGKFFWRNLRQMKNFTKGASFPLESDINLEDDQLIEELDNQIQEEMTKYVKKDVKKEAIQISNNLFEKVIVGGLVYYNFIL